MLHTQVRSGLRRSSDRGGCAGRAFPRLRSLQLLLEERQRDERLARVARPLHRVAREHLHDRSASAGCSGNFEEEARRRLRVRRSAVGRERELAVSISKRMTPRANTSLRSSSGAPRRCSGRHVRRCAAVDLAMTEGVGEAEVEQLHLAVLAEVDVSGALGRGG